MRFTARPRVGGRRAVGRWRRVVVLVVADPLRGAGPAHPLRGRAVTRLGSRGRAGRSWDDSRLCVGVVGLQAYYLTTTRNDGRNDGRGRAYHTSFTFTQGVSPCFNSGI